MIKKNAWSQSNRSKRYNILVLSIAILREVCKGLGTDEEPRIPANLSLTRVKSSRGRENTLPSTLLMRAYSQSYLSSPGVSFFFFVSFKSCSTLFLLLADVVFFFGEVIAKLILATCAWAWQFLFVSWLRNMIMKNWAIGFSPSVMLILNLFSRNGLEIF